jgi:hypothetical protein
MKPNDSPPVGTATETKVILMASMFNPRREAFNPATRGYHAVYRPNAVNHCPGCGRSHWLIGRLLAECGFCATALPLSDSAVRGASPVFQSRGSTLTDLAA